MRNWEITYTEDVGTTYKTTIIEAKTYTEALINAMAKIKDKGIITKVEETTKGK